MSALGFAGALSPFPGRAALDPAVPKASGAEAMQRADRLTRLRAIRLANATAARAAAVQTPNGDETLYARRNYIGSYSKGLPHDVNGLPDPVGYRRFVAAVRDGKQSEVDAIPAPLLRAIVTALEDIPYSFEGNDTTQFALPPAPPLASQQMAAEMVELYWLALARDVPFSRYGDDKTVARACEELGRVAVPTMPRGSGGIDPQTIFRAPGAPLEGPHLSQFYWADVSCPPVGSVPQRLHFNLPGKDFLIDRPAFLRAQTDPEPFRAERVPDAKFMHTLRHLADVLGRDGFAAVFANAGAIIAGLPDEAKAPFFDPIELEALVARAQTLAGYAVYYQKIDVHRRVRPEAVANLVDLARGGMAFPLHTDLTNSRAAQEVVHGNGNALLPQVYTDGCPGHPSYPAAHSGIAGSIVTILKAFTIYAYPYPSPAYANDDGSALLPYTGKDLTLGGELDKLAANFALGRDAAGVHFRSDSLGGLHLGEAVALTLLRDMAWAAPAAHGPFVVRKFDGTTVRIGA